MAKAPRYISGIFNYCDCWCVCCSLTSCSLDFPMVMEVVGDETPREVANDDFWAKRNSVFQHTKKMIIDWTVEHVVELDNIDFEYSAAEGLRQSTESKNHTLSQAADRYADMVG